ncbi:SMI1/KNR4 family protein [Lysinibacillus sp. NPDC094403]|uniref:SMI1/KNR4 family protein n=1 Tax=Lysinibacillus sp. NPDC094403 TaxID=3390581 RepID=UPI003D028D39
MDERIDMHIPLKERLCFADYINNGGKSSLFIDFNPNEGGQVGQVIRYIHDTDSNKVIAPSFEAYLQHFVRKNSRTEDERERFDEIKIL